MISADAAGDAAVTLEHADSDCGCGIDEVDVAADAFGGVDVLAVGSGVRLRHESAISDAAISVMGQTTLLFMGDCAFMVIPTAQALRVWE